MRRHDSGDIDVIVRQFKAARLQDSRVGVPDTIKIKKEGDAVKERVIKRQLVVVNDPVRDIREIPECPLVWDIQRQ